MGFLELFLIGVGLSMDAFAVAICQGLSMTKIKWGHALTVGLYFGGFQALMPLLGWVLGSQFSGYIQQFDHWVAFILETPILSAVSLIGVTTFCISVAGVAVGCWFGARYKRRAEITGGVILVLLGCKILLEHLGLLSF